MAALAASTITRMRTVPHYGRQDILTIQVYVDSTLATSDTIDSAALGVEGILGVLGASKVSSAGAIEGAAGGDVTLLAKKQTELGDQLASASDVASGTGNDLITLGSAFNTDIGAYLTLLVTT